MIDIVKLVIYTISILLSILINNCFATDRYVNKDCSIGCDGTTWEKGWPSFASIDWNQLTQNNDSLYISGGSSGKTYEETLFIAHDTTNRLFIKPGSASPSPVGHSGRVVITNLSSYANAIQLGTNSGTQAKYITIDGETTPDSGTINMTLGPVDCSGVYWRFNSTNATIRYVEVTQTGLHGYGQCHAITADNTNDDTEVSNCFIHDLVHNRAIKLNAETSDYGKIKIHNNTIGPGLKDDALAISMGADIYNNLINGIGSGEGHPDGLQADGNPSYFRIYNNIIHDFAQLLYFEPRNGGNWSNTYIYNNIFYQSQGSEVANVGIIGENQNQNAYIDNVQILNNTFVDLGLQGIRLFCWSGYTWEVTNSAIANNIFYNVRTNLLISSEVGEGSMNYSDFDLQLMNNNFYNSSGFSVKYGGGVSKIESSSSILLNARSEYTIGNSGLQPLFTDYVNHDYHLTSFDTAARDKGKEFSAVFSNDKDGLSRPQNIRWDIGSYEYQFMHQLGAPSSFSGGTIQ